MIRSKVAHPGTCEELKAFIILIKEMTNPYEHDVAIVVGALGAEHQSHPENAAKLLAEWCGEQTAENLSAITTYSPLPTDETLSKVDRIKNINMNWALNEIKQHYEERKI